MKTCTFLWVCSLMFLRRSFCFASGREREGSQVNDGPIVSVTTRVKDTAHHRELGEIRYHYDSTMKLKCLSTIIIGVGTFMSVADYDKLSENIATGSSTVLIIADHNPGNLVKTSHQRYAHLANAIHAQLPKVVPVCTETYGNIFLGGHSSSGQASLKAIQLGLIEFQWSGYMGFDPFDMSIFHDENFILDQPGIFWGFTQSSCHVLVEHAALAAYNLTSSDARVLYAIRNDDHKITHCVFTDHGCGNSPFICSTRHEFEWIFKYIGTSIKLFIDAVHDNIPFNETYFNLQKDETFSLFVNEDEVETPKESVFLMVEDAVLQN